MARWENTHVVRLEENVPPKHVLAHATGTDRGRQSKLGKWGITTNTGATEPGSN